MTVLELRKILEEYCDDVNVVCVMTDGSATAVPVPVRYVVDGEQMADKAFLSKVILI